MNPLLHIKQLSAGILQHIDLTLDYGQCLAILGTSGSGKTTLLNAIAGNIAYTGQITIAGQSVTTLAAWQRPCRYLNQRLYLFPHLTLEQNLRLAQYAVKKPQHLKARLALLDMLGIGHLAKRYPTQISGGEQQRAALARALISEPALLLLDEPFSSLDWPIRTSLWRLVQQIQVHRNIAILLVTHEPKEASALAQQDAYLQAGRLQYSPAERR